MASLLVLFRIAGIHLGWDFLRGDRANILAQVFNLKDIWKFIRLLCDVGNALINVVYMSSRVLFGQGNGRPVLQSRERVLARCALFGIRSWTWSTAGRIKCRGRHREFAYPIRVTRTIRLVILVSLTGLRELLVNMVTIRFARGELAG